MFKFLSSIPCSTTFKLSKAFASGNVYTWGKISSGTGFSEYSSDPILRKPRLLPHFESNVSKVSMGQWHSAMITADGQLHTCGYGRKGCLGHDNYDDEWAPNPVEFFQNKKVIDVACDGTYTLALTEDGSLWRWGYIPTIPGEFKEEEDRLVTQMTNVPQRVPGFEGLRVISLNVGKNFVSVFTDQGIINWGVGSYGNFGNNCYLNISVPTENQHVKEFLQQSHLKIVKAKTSGWSTVVQLSNGKLYGMGDNFHGQLGIRKNVGIVNDEYVSELTPIVEEAITGKKIVDFDLGGNSLLILTDDNQVYFSGLNLICKPTLWNLPKNVKIKKLFASYETFAVLSTENKIYAFNENLVKDSEFDPYNETYEIDSSFFNNGEILDIGGRYNIHYALVKN